jgi:hypothetical protein
MATKERDSVLVVGASGRTGAYVTRYLCAASVPVIACVRRADRLPAEPLLERAEVATANLERPDTIAPLIDRAVHVIYLAGSERRSLSPGAWQLEVEALSTSLEIARRSGFDGRWIYVGYSGAEQRGSATWAETRWRELKVEAEQALVASPVNYFILRTGHLSGPVNVEPNVSVSQQTTTSPDAELPCNVLAFLLTGAALAGATHRSKATVQLNAVGFRLQEAVQAFGRLKTDGVAAAADSVGVLSGRH